MGFSEEEKNKLMRLGEMIDKARRLFEKLLTTIVREVTGINIKVVIDRVPLCYGAKNDGMETIIVDKYTVSFSFPRVILRTLFHEACHNIVFKEYFKGNLERRKATYKKFGYDSNPEEIMCDSFGKKYANIMPSWLVEDLGRACECYRSLLLSYTSLKSVFNEEKYRDAEKYYREFEKMVDNILEKIKTNSLPRASEEDIMEIIRFLVNHGYGVFFEW